MTQHQGTNHLLTRSTTLLAIDHYGQRSRNTLITTTRVTHHRHLRTTHSCITRRGCVREDARKDAVAHNLNLSIATQHLTQCVTVITRKGTLGSRLIQTHRLLDKLNLLQRSCHRKVIDLAQRQDNLVLALNLCCCHTIIAQHLAIKSQIYKVGMSARDYSHRTVLARYGFNLHIEFLADTLLQFDCDAILVDILLATRHGIVVGILQHLQFILRATDKRTQRNGDGQTNHSRSRNAYTHSILQNICTQTRRNLLGQRAQQLGSSRHTQRHSNRLGATDGWHNLALYHSDNRLTHIL